MERGAVKGRFAPTPSGRMHLGNLLCALLAWLSARAEGGRVVLRIEDLDAMRSPRAYADLLEDDLRWLGLSWDEGGSSGGPDGPYYQSERTALYRAALARLEEQGLVYPCFCSRAQLHAAQAPHLSDGRVLYSGACRDLSAQEVAQRRRERPPALRLRVSDETVSFVDKHLGPYSENLQRECGDFLVCRSDGVFLYRLLGLPAPTFAHIPLLTAPDGRRLSKRDGDLDLGAIRRRLPGPEPLLGLLGWLCGLLERPEPVRAQELIPLFSWAKIPRGDLSLPASLWTLLGQRNV